MLSFADKYDFRLVWFDSLRPSQQLGPVGTVSSLNHSFFQGKLD